MGKRKLDSRPKKEPKKAKLIDQDFTLWDIPHLENPRTRHGREDRTPRGTAREYATKLEEKVCSWVDKYVLDDMPTLQTRLSSEKLQEIIKAAEGYCVQCPLEIFEHLLPASVYQCLPKLLAHAIMNKSLWQVIENPFYSIDPKFAPGPPERFSTYAGYLYREFNYSRRDDAVKWRQLTVRLFNAKDLWEANAYGIGYETRDRKQVANTMLADQLLDPSGPLACLLKNKSDSKEQRQEVVDLYTLAGEISILCGLTELDFLFRRWHEIPVYRSRNDRMMELASVSKAAQAENAKRDRGIKLWPVVIMLRPPFSYFIDDLLQGPETNEHFVSPAIVVVTKTEAPVFDPYNNRRPKYLTIPDSIPPERRLFSSFGPELEEQLNSYFPALAAKYNKDGNYPFHNWESAYAAAEELVSPWSIEQQANISVRYGVAPGFVPFEPSDGPTGVTNGQGVFGWVGPQTFAGSWNRSLVAD
ncbi:hypothetical protein BDW59DRAFT_156573 [Aspergillus cavernicola]|uniref:Uncharacterized protein n=1 Tax=Aspergillus cavernicola TaxID=176166 RepID=A0ABR4J1I6_9EURO